MAHTALARRYRPRRFAEVATQEHVSETLRRAVAGGRVGHAYLFCGPRGVGKTTLARVLAMALNCPVRQDTSGTDLDPGEPCGECESCRRIWAGSTALDVVEIDAASNRGVDDARELRSRAMYAPSEEGRFKVYIVDEAHMLTREAWNALLKVLEEPPERVIFIFATTEPEKIEQTAAPILSRCQRFDFRRVAVAEIVDRLREVLARESTEAPDDALRLIARKADGGMRDALSLTDQVLALADGSGITVETVRRILGVVEEERFLETMDLLVARDRAGLFRLVETLLDQGYDLVEFYHGLMEALRTLLRLRVGGEVPDLPAEHQREWRARADAFEPADLIRMLGMASALETGGSLRRSSQPRVLLELLLLQFSYLDRTVEMEALLEALGGEDPGERPAGPAPQSTGPAPGGPVSPGPRSAPTGTSPQGPSSTSPAGSAPSGSPAGSAPSGSPAGSSGGSSAAAPPPDASPSEAPPARGSTAAPPANGTPGPPDSLLDHWKAATERVDEDHVRISEGEARAGKLSDLLDEEPGLRDAVEGWDLEIIE